MHHRKYTEQEFRDAVASSFSKRQVLQKLGIVAQGGNYRVINRAIKEYDLDTSHFLGQNWNKGRKFGPKRPIKEYLSNKYPIQSHKLRLRLLDEGYFEHKCSNCSLKEWMNSPIPLELDHINGVHDDNSLENLRLLCPNCHSMTPTFRGKNKA